MRIAQNGADGEMTGLKPQENGEFVEDSILPEWPLVMVAKGDSYFAPGEKVELDHSNSLDGRTLTHWYFSRKLQAFVGYEEQELLAHFEYSAGGPNG